MQLYLLKTKYLASDDFVVPIWAKLRQNKWVNVYYCTHIIELAVAAAAAAALAAALASDGSSSIPHHPLDHSANNNININPKIIM